jgi:cyclic-di-AMP phosphodiesterase PgpH
MKGMKNELEISKKTILLRIYNSFLEHLKAEDKSVIGRYALLMALSSLVAILIQNRFGIESIIGGFLLAILFLMILYRDIKNYSPKYMKKYPMLLLGIMIMGTLLMGRVHQYVFLNLSKGTGFLSPEGAIFGMPIAAGGVLVTLLFDFHTSIFFSFLVSVLTGIWLQDALYPVYAFVGSLSASSFCVLGCKKRAAIIKAGLYVGGVNLVTAAILLLFKAELFTAKAISALVFASLTSVTITAVVSLTLPIFEYLFNVTTDINLIELLDLNQPLMKSLMISAPGTYHHSVIVGNLVETAAEAIGVNPLLARVSAYYHDIGKIKMPEYFIENYKGAASKHEKLSPHLSTMIITSHVKEGIELARQHKLPQVIIDIIQQHHGTGVITYFYQKAKEYYEPSKPVYSQRTNELPGSSLHYEIMPDRHEHGPLPPEEEFRYPGPKPQTRVAALVMMADAVEAASRVLIDPTPVRISALVNRIINYIFLEGQLDECELTLKDIFLIRKHFSYILTGILHKRIDYPGFDFGSDQKKTPPKDDEGFHKESPKTLANKPPEVKKGFPETPQGVQSPKI